MNDIKIQKREDGTLVRTKTGVKKGRQHTIFAGTQVDLYALCESTFALGEGKGFTLGDPPKYGKDNQGNPIALLNAAVDGKCLEVNVPAHRSLTRDLESGDLFGFESTTWNKREEKMEKNLASIGAIYVFADDQDLGNLLNFLEREFNARVNGYFVDDNWVDEYNKQAGGETIKQPDAESVIAHEDTAEVESTDERAKTEDEITKILAATRKSLEDNEETEDKILLKLAKKEEKLRATGTDNKAP